MDFYCFIPMLFIVKYSIVLKIVASQVEMNFQNRIIHEFSIYNLFGNIFWHHIPFISQNLLFFQSVNLLSKYFVYFNVLILKMLSRGK